MARKPRPRGERVRARGLDFYITEHAHAYVVRNNTVKWGATVDQSRLALFQYLGKKKWTAIAAMPYRYMYTSEIGEEVPCSSVVFYFNIGKREHYKPKDRDRYKP